MSKHFYFLIIAIVSGILTYFLGDNVLNPVTNEGALNSTNILIMGIFSNITLISLLSFIQISLGKLFRGENFKEIGAIRRSILLTILLDFLAFLRIFGLWSVLNLILATLIVITIELFFSTPSSKETIEEEHN